MLWNRVILTVEIQFALYLCDSFISNLNINASSVEKDFFCRIEFKITGKNSKTFY